MILSRLHGAIYSAGRYGPTSGDAPGRLNNDGPSGSLLNGSYIASGTKLEIENAVGAQGLVTDNAGITLQNVGLITNNVGNDIVSGFLTTNNGSLNQVNTTLNLTNALTNNGGIFVGDGITPATFTSPGFTNGAGGNISIGTMSTFDVSAGAFTLNGEIEFDFISFVPDATVYHVLLYGSHSGTFTSTVIDNLSGYTAHLN